MTETELNIGQPQNSITHLTAMSEQGWVLQWGESQEPMFEVVCHGLTAMQVERLDGLLSDGYRKAMQALK